MSFLVSLLVGISVGAAYALLGVKSPAPPMVALIGLLGIVIGEHEVSWVQAQIEAQHAPALASGNAERHSEQRRGT